jgi:NADH-quinone oxidoreductase subunit C
VTRNPSDRDRPAPGDPQGKNWNPGGTPAGPGAYGVDRRAPEPSEGEAVSSNTDLEFAHRTALAVREEFGGEVLQTVHFRKEWTVTVKPERLLEIMTFLRDTWNYRTCSDVTSVDLYPEEPRFLTVYHLLNMDRATRFRVKSPVSGENPVIDSVVPVWLGADYTEREVYDMMGIRFRGHPDLRRILMPEDYEHYPLRKDFPLTGFPVGIDALKD